MSSTHFECLLNCGKPCESTDSIDNMTQGAWEKLKLKSLNWKGCDRFGNVYDSVDWELGPYGKHLHASCRLDISSSDKLKRSKLRQQKQEESSFHDEICHQEQDLESPAPKRLRSSTGIVHNKNLCVWCMKPEDVRHPERTGRWVLLSYTSAWNVFRSHTVILQDNAMRDRINCLINSITDPFSTEIRYHHKCWLKYVGQYQKLSAEEKIPLMHDVTFREAQTMFIDHARQVVFVDHEIITLQGLLREYKNIMGTYGLPNLGVKSSYIKEILVHEFGEGIGFHAPPRKNQSEVVYDTSGSSSYVEAVISLLGIDNDQLIQNVARMLREEITKVRILPWPPQVRELEQEENTSPLLVQFISSLRKPGKVITDAKVLALASMLTYYATSRPTTTSVNLGMYLHGLSRSRELVDIFHKVGVCINYASVLLLKDAWAVHDLQLCSDCPNEIAEGKPGVIIVDNDDFQNDTLTGGNTSHRTNVMYVQQAFLENHGPHSSGRITDTKTLSTTLKEIATGMQTHGRYITSKRGEPPVSTRIQACAGSTEPHKKRCAIHALVRADDTGERPDATNQKVPGFAGFQALISAPVEKSKAYYFMTYPEPPKKSVLNDVMMKITKAIQRKNMPFAVVVGDQPVYTLLVEIKNEHSQMYENIIPFLGPFHTQSSMIYAIYKRYNGSGIADVLVAAGVIAEGSVDHALRGKHYRRALRCLSLMYETLMHLLLNKNHAGLEFSAHTKSQLAVLREPISTSQECLASAIKHLENDPAIDGLICSMFNDLKESDMANYWIDFMSMVEILMMNVHAIHTCNWEEYLISLQQMMPWLVAYDQTNYARWLPDFWAKLTSLNTEQTQFFSSNFAQSMTGKPYSSIPWDMWIEMTMNKGSKMKAGWVSILRNEKQLLADTKNVNNINQIRVALHGQVNKKLLSQKHKECAPTRMNSDEQAIQDLLSCFKEFDCLPFNLASPALRTLQSAIPATPELIQDFKKAKQDGEAQLKVFMDERIYSKEKSIHDRIKRNSRLTFAKIPLKKVTGEAMKMKQGEMESRALASVVNLVDVSGLLSLSELMKHRISEECLTLFNANGTFRKTQKSKLVQKLVLQPIDVDSYTALVDMGMIWRLASPTTEERVKSDGSQYTWGDYTDKIVSMILARHTRATTIICVNDPYDYAESIKDDERQLRIQGQGSIPNVYMKPADLFPTTCRFKTILCNAGNKKRLQALIKAQFLEQSNATSQEVVYSVGEDCVSLSTGDTKDNFSFSQGEADTIMLSVYAALRSSGYSDPVVIDAEDTDVYIQAAAISHHIPGILCIKKKKQVFFCRSMCSEDVANCLIPFHVLTGCDANSCFFGHGKMSLYEKLLKSTEARSLISKCGEGLTLSDYVFNDIKSFVIRYIYGDTRSSTLNQARATKWKSLKKKSLMRLLPDDDSLKQHIKRANFLAYIQRHPDLRSHPSPIGHGWELVNGYCRPVRHTKPALPSSIQISLTQQEQCNSDSDSNSEVESEDEFNSDSDSEPSTELESSDEL